MSKYQIKKGHRIKKLIGQQGVRCNVRLPKGTILGQYTGCEYLENEFDDVFKDSNEYNLICMQWMRLCTFLMMR